MLSNDYDPYDQLESLSVGFRDLVAILNRQQNHLDSIMRHIRAQETLVQQINMRLTVVEQKL